MRKVKFNQEGKTHWAYFIDSRRVIGVNQTGATILDEVLNLDQDVEQVVCNIAERANLPTETVRSDVKAFLSSISNELSPEVFNVTPQIQTSTPWGVELEITGCCNLRCRHCLQGSYGHQMTFDKASTILESLAQVGVFEVSIIGGEPFVHPNILPILRLCEQYEFVTNIVTNATLIGPEEIEFLSSMRSLSVFVSLEGLGETHDLNRGKGVFIKVDEAVKQMLEAGIRVEFIFTLMSTNIEIYPAVLEYGKKIGVPCNFNLFKPFRDEHWSLTPKPDDFFRTVVELFEKRMGGDHEIGLSNSAIVSHLLGIKPRNECRASQSGVVINAQGRMLPCPSLLFSGYYDGSELPEFDQNFVDTWKNHPVFAKFRQNGLRGCQARSHIFCGDVTKPDPYGEEAFLAYCNK